MGIVFEILVVFTITISICNCGSSDREEVVFYEDTQFEGDRLFLSLARGCYSFDDDWNDRVSSVDTQGLCITAWKEKDCEGSSMKFAPGVRGMGNLKQHQFDNAISSIAACDAGNVKEGTISSRRNGKNAGNGEDLQIWRAAVNEHNKYRRLHGVPDLHGDPNLHQAAQNHADYLAKNNKFETSRGTEFGENLATSYEESKVNAIHDVVKRWYDKIELYDFRHPESNKNRPTSGQFSSIIWKATTHLGIGVARNEDQGKWIVVAFYDPPATQSNYGRNVPTPLKW